MRSFVVLAHRGAARELPENTLEAFARALEIGADGIETDAHLTRDGHVVLAHDANGGRTAGVHRRIAEATLREVQSWDAGFAFVAGDGMRPFVEQGFRVPTLDAALERFPHAFFNVDAKDGSKAMIDALVDTVRRHRAESRVRLASFSSRTLGRIRACGYRGPLSLGRREVAWIALAPAFLLRSAPFGADAAQVPLSAYGVSLDATAFRDRCHRLGLQVHYWTIDEPAEALRLRAAGADGVVTNDPRTIVRALAGVAAAASAIS